MRVSIRLDARERRARAGDTMITRRSWIGAALGSSLMAGRAAAEETWPIRPVRIIVPFGAGVSHDALTRLLAEELRGRFGQNFLVENITGAGGNIGMAAIARAAPDGYTIGSATVGTLTINAFLYTSMPYDAERDFTPLSLIWEAPNCLFVSAGNPSRTLAEFVAWAKARPKGVTYGSSGIGTTPHLSGELFGMKTGIAGTHVPYRDASQRLVNLSTGDLDFAIDNVASYAAFLQEGKVRGLAVTSAARWPALPDVPTMAEAGVPEFVVTSWGAMVMPTKTPPEIVRRLNEAIASIMSTASFQERYLKVGARAAPSTPEQLAAYAARERSRWGQVVKASGAKFQ